LSIFIAKYIGYNNRNMKRLLAIVLLIVLIYFLAVHIVKQIDLYGYFDGGSLPATMVLSGISRVQIEKEIREYYQSQLSEEVVGKSDLENAHISATYVDIDRDSFRDLLVILKSEATCGSGGCLSSIFLQNEAKAFKPLNFLYAVKNIEPLESYTNGMRDLKVNDSNSTRMIWNGDAYILESL